MNEWAEIERKAKSLTGRPVEVLLVNGYTVRGHLTGVGYAGLTVLRAGTSIENGIEGRLVVDVIERHKGERGGETTVDAKSIAQDFARQHIHGMVNPASGRLREKTRRPDLRDSDTLMAVWAELQRLAQKMLLVVDDDHG
jgi:hypothetical protein